MDIQTALSNFLNEVGTTRAVATQRSYGNGLNCFLEYAKEHDLEPNLPIEVIDIDFLIGFPAYLSQLGYSKKTINLYATSVRAWTNWLTINAYIDPTPRDSLRFQQAYKELNRVRSSRLPRWPKKGDVPKMIDAAYNLPWESPRKERDIAIIEFFASSGCRNAEVCGLKIQDIDMRNRSALVIGKGDKQRMVFFSQECANALVKYWSVRGDRSQKSPAFCRHDKGAGHKIKPLTTATMRNVVSDVADLAGVEPFSPHYFRHSFAIKTLKESGNLALVQDLLGHSDPAATRVYAKIYPDDLRDMHRRIFG